MSFKWISLLGLVALVGCTAQVSDDQLRQWVMDNPEVIMDSVMAYQRAEQERNQPQPAMVSEFRRQLFESASSPVAGNPKGKVEVAYFFDFNCGHCARQSETINAVIEANNDVKVVYKNFPVLGPSSELAARAALAAHQQNKFKEFYSEVYKTRERSPDAFKAIASRLGLDVAKWEQDMDSDKVNQELQATRDLAQKMKIGGTPFLAIAPDKVFPGRVDELKAVIENL